MFCARTALVIGCLFAKTVLADSVDFEREIKPFLESKCLSCHNPNNTKGGVSLSESGDVLNKVVSPGQASESLLYTIAVPSKEGEPPEMPKKGDSLTEAEATLLKRWIDEGAVWPEGLVLREASKADLSWWAYQKLTTPTLDTIDAFIEARLQEESLERNPPADRRTLIRRAAYDLTGLPPSPGQVEAFERDEDPEAYENLIDRLLASSHYGERWGRHWLDVVRFGESNGFERNVIINNLWPFRDYVIKSLNEDKPMDQFIREHLAGDVFGADDPEVAIGSAFLVAGPYDDVGNQDAEAQAQIRANTLDEMIKATSEAFLGMTLGCARCHDHKFDPISQQDYYQLYATFAAIKHGSVPLGTRAERAAREAVLKPLNDEKARLEEALRKLDETILKRAEAKRDYYENTWKRPKVDRRMTVETFAPVNAKFIRLVCEAQDANPQAKRFNIDEFEVWSASDPSINVALSANGGQASGAARKIEDFAHAYSADLAIDGRLGARFLGASDRLTITLAKPTEISRVVFSSARNEDLPGQGKFTFVADFRLEVSLDGETWQEVAHGRDRQPVDDAHRRHRFLIQEITDLEKKDKLEWLRALVETNKRISQAPGLRSVWLGTRDEAAAKGPFHLFLGGSPQKKGPPVVPASLSTLSRVTPAYELPATSTESERRMALAEWITGPDNPLTLRVLANRLWHYHFGVGIVDTPNDFGYMGGRPSHPELLDFLANKLKANGWRLKDLHRLIMLSKTYRQSSAWRQEAAKSDAASRLLWRFPPRRLSAEEIRDTLLVVADQLDTTMGGPGFRLYRFLQDNVSTYEPLDEHDLNTYRRAVYHQNARASVVDLMTEYDQPDCAFSSPRRAQTTSPLQALTLLNHSFTVDMAEALAKRIKSQVPEEQAQELFRLAYQRKPTPDEQAPIAKEISKHGVRSVCRAVLNSSELIYLD